MSNENIVPNERPSVEELSDIDKDRIKKAKWAEFVDSWRIVPRLLVAGYAWLTWEVVDWYMHIQPTLTTCKIVNNEKICGIIEKAGPTTQHAALVAAVIGAAAIVFGFYTNSGKDWSKPMIPWLKKK